MTTELEIGAVAIVTGAARGIGAAIAMRLAREGFAVAVLDRQLADCAATVDAISSTGGVAMALAADVAVESAIVAAVEQVAQELGPPTVLVNNAGIGQPADLLDVTAEQWDAMLAVNLRAPVLLARATCPYMIEAGWGRVVSISSVSALGDAGRVAYASAKAGLIGMTKTLALELGPHGITTNAVAPGFVVSDMTRLSAQRRGIAFEEYREAAARAIPVGRVGQPEDVANAVLFFVSQEAGLSPGRSSASLGDRLT